MTNLRTMTNINIVWDKENKLQTTVDHFLRNWQINPGVTCNTSGTTGPPKSISHSKKVLYEISEQVIDWLDITPSHTIYCTVPAHTIAFYTVHLIPAMLTGAEIIIESFNPSNYIKRLKEIKPDSTVIIPRVWNVMSKQKEWNSIDLSGCKVVMGSDFVSQAQIDNIKELGGIPIHSYGSTEVPPMVCKSDTAKHLGIFSEKIDYKIEDNILVIKWRSQDKWWYSNDKVKKIKGNIQLLERKL